MKKMLLPTEFSPYCKAILEHLPELSRIGVEEIGLLHVINLTRVSGVSGGIDIENYIESETKVAEEEIPKMVEVIEKHGIKANAILPPPVGDPVAEILRYSEDYDFIAMASRGGSLLKEILLGSVTEGVVKNSKIPVYVFKFKVKKKDKDIVECSKYYPDLFERILVAYDFSNHSDEALEYAKYIAKKSESKIYILHVEEPEYEKHDVEKVVEEISAEKINVEAITASGSPAKVILRTADKIGATTIFMGSRGRGTIETILLGSTSDVVVRRSNVPVFICRATKDED